MNIEFFVIVVAFLLFTFLMHFVLKNEKKEVRNTTMRALVIFNLFLIALTFSPYMNNIDSVVSDINSKSQYIYTNKNLN